MWVALKDHTINAKYEVPISNSYWENVKNVFSLKRKWIGHGLKISEIWNIHCIGLVEHYIFVKFQSSILYSYWFSEGKRNCRKKHVFLMFDLEWPWEVKKCHCGKLGPINAYNHAKLQLSTSNSYWATRDNVFSRERARCGQGREFG